MDYDQMDFVITTTKDDDGDNHKYDAQTGSESKAVDVHQKHNQSSAESGSQSDE